MFRRSTHFVDHCFREASDVLPSSSCSTFASYERIITPCVFIEKKSVRSSEIWERRTGVQSRSEGRERAPGRLPRELGYNPNPIQAALGCNPSARRKIL